MNKRPRTIVLLGISGSGKDTQAAVLRRHIRSIEISTGDGLRAIARRKNVVGGFMAGILRRGAFAPYWTPVYVWLDRFIIGLRGDEHVIFSGSPRLTREARILDDFMGDIGRPLPVAVYLWLPPRPARSRLLARGRADDNPRAIASRFRFFRECVLPVVDYYRRHGRLITINGDQSRAAVWRDIRRALRLR